MIAHDDGGSNCSHRWLDDPFMARNDQPAQDEEPPVKQAIQMLEGACAVFGPKTGQQVKRCKKNDETGCKVAPQT